MARRGPGPPPSRPPAASRWAPALVAAGGATGASTRWLAEEAIGPRGFPWALLVVNVVGCAVVGAAAARATRTATGEALRLGVGVGFCGGLPTFSGFALAAVRLHDDGRAAAAVVFVAVSVVAGVAAVVAGAAAARRVAERRAVAG